MAENHKLWGGRFEASLEKWVEEFGASISFDQKMAEFDLKGSIAHVTMLGETGIIAQEEALQIKQGLEELLEEYKAGKLEFDVSNEDIHMNIESHVSLEDIAHNLDITPQYAVSCFKKHMGISLMKYSKKIRIDRSKVLLMTTTKSILDIALILGFYDQSHFSKTFKSFEGVSPSEFRNTHYK